MRNAWVHIVRKNHPGSWRILALAGTYRFIQLSLEVSVSGKAFHGIMLWRSRLNASEASYPTKSSNSYYIPECCLLLYTHCFYKCWAFIAQYMISFSRRSSAKSWFAYKGLSYFYAPPPICINGFLAKVLQTGLDIVCHSVGRHSVFLQGHCCNHWPPMAMIDSSGYWYTPLPDKLLTEDP